MLGCPGNGLSVPRSQTAPRNASPVPRNRSDVPRNAKIVPGNILAPGNAGTVPGNAENQNEQVSFSYASRLPFDKAESPRGDMDLGRHSLFSCSDVPAHLLMRGHPQKAPPTRTAPTPASSISRRARRSTRDTLPWAAYTFHTLGNKVLHKTRCAKDRGRSKDTFGNRFEVYWYDAGDGVLHEDDWHFKLMRWQLIALYVIIGDGSLSENAVVPLMQLVT
jgi:hypothetical protein